MAFKSISWRQICRQTPCDAYGRNDRNGMRDKGILDREKKQLLIY